MEQQLSSPLQSTTLMSHILLLRVVHCYTPEGLAFALQGPFSPLYPTVNPSQGL